MRYNPDFIIVPFDVLADDRLTLRQIRVLMSILSWRKKNTNVSAISREMIAERTGYPPSRVSTITSELETLGWIKKDGNGGRSRWIRYQICDVHINKKDGLNGYQNSDCLDDERIAETVTVTKTETVTDSDLNGYRNSNLNGYQNGNETVTKRGTRIDTDRYTNRYTERNTEKETGAKTNKKENQNLDGANAPGVCFSDDENSEPENHNNSHLDDMPTQVLDRGAISTYCRSQGINATPSHALQKLIDQGAVMQHFVDAVVIAKDRGNSNWAYVLGIVRNLLAEEARPQSVPNPRPRQTSSKRFDGASYIYQQARERVNSWALTSSRDIQQQQEVTVNEDGTIFNILGIGADS